ncbi:MULTISPECIES: helix-turn-helix transcriptional regulator [unclassified Ruminococcus]|uniref:helix-turn-helix domain-containing protein n=1 Tax=unclassified Ruminococcus TaxID=2608920 RepID=UPI00210C7FCE|nr:MULTISPECIES: helix-turn-helix transcriptional regulator [unclassified Ruminococcus]MCQ4022359.1 helix-turn-helix domain-containing protein [Ruminococcus sp. zg-924]MCQ4114687.1 helix-turn-helix domain-containing protein [Ruminococcus sp. zg-921]
MKISYKKLWKLLIDKDMKKKELMEKASISTTSIRRLNNSESVTIEILGRICKVLNCTLDDICEFIDTDEE